MAGLRPKETIAGRYELQGVVRTGGVSVVHRARDLFDDRLVAVKIITVQGAEDALRRRIEREMEILTALDHPHIVGCHDAGQLGDSRMFLVLEWLDGEDLADFLLRAPFSLRQALTVVEQVAGALERAHASGIIHRDIKPANIYLLAPSVGALPDCRVLDFGVAKIPESLAPLTRAGAILGTPSYMAPEQANEAMTVDGRADVFSLGVVAFELVAGALPWNSGTDLARLAHILIEDARPLRAVVPEVPAAAADLIDAMLRSDPDERIDTAKTARALALDCLDGLPGDELDTVYARRTLGDMLRESTMDVTGDLGEPTQMLDTLSATAPLPVVVVEDERSEETISALDVPSAPRRPAVRLQPLDDSGDLLSYVDHVPGAMIFGRVSEVERLRSRALTPMTTSRPSYTLVVGPAGIGKTRVRTELARLVRQTKKPPRVFAGRAEEAMQNTPFAYVRKVLFAAARIAPRDDNNTRRDKILAIVPAPAHLAALLDVEAGGEAAEKIAERDAGRTLFFTGEALHTKTPRHERMMEAEAERATVVAFVCEALGIQYPEIPPVIAAKSDPRLLGEQMRRAIGLVLSAVSTPDGMVVLVDDVHLLDRQSAAVFAELLDPSRTVPLALIAFALPHFLDADERSQWPLGDIDQMMAEVIELSALEARPARELARSVVTHELESEALEALVGRARGNPLYLEQLVHAVKTIGLLAPSDAGAYAFAGASEDIVDRIPPTVAAAVSARMLARTNFEQRLLTAAAVFGEVFWTEGVATILALPVEEVQIAFDGMILANIVRRRQVARYEGAAELEFTHAVLRSVALSRLKRSRRQVLERKVVEYFDEVGEADAALVAMHAAQSDDPTSGAPRFREAATVSLKLGDPESAGVLVEAGLACLEGEEATEERKRLFDVLERVAIVGGDWDMGREALDGLTATTTDPAQRARLLLRRTRLACLAKRYEEAIVQANAAKAAFEALGRTVDVAEAELGKAEACEALGDGRNALRSYLFAQNRLDRDDAEGVGRVSLGLARIAIGSGDYRSAENRLRGALVHASTLRNHGMLFRTNVGLAEVSRLLGDPARAREYLSEAKRVGFDRERKLLLRIHEARLLTEEHRHEDAYERLETIYALAEDVRSLGTVRRMSALMRGQMLRARNAGGAEVRPTSRRLASVEAHLERALGSASTEEPALEMALEMALAVVLALRGDDVRAKKMDKTALERFEKEGAVLGDEPPWMSYAHARVLQLTGTSVREVEEAMAKAVRYVDSIARRLERKDRQRYLERWPSKTIVAEAERAGVEVERDPSSWRLTTKG